MDETQVDIQLEQAIDKPDSATFDLCDFRVKETEHNLDLVLLEELANDVAAERISLRNIKQHVKHADEGHGVFQLLLAPLQKAEELSDGVAHDLLSPVNIEQ